MKNITQNFEYFAPKTVEDALSLLSRYGDKCRILAGGQDLLLLMRRDLIVPEYVIDIKGISDLDYIDFDDKEDLRIGALTTHRTLEKSPLFKNGFSILSEMEQNLGSVELRNWGTIGGSLCIGRPCGDPAPLLIVLNGRIKIASLRGERITSIESFNLAPFEVDLRPDELLVEIQVPNSPPRNGVSYKKFSQLEEDCAFTAAAVSITLNHEKNICDDIKIALSMAPTAMRAKKSEEVLKGKEINANLLAEAGQVASEEAGTLTEQASKGYKKKLVRILAKEVSDQYRRELMKVLVRRAGEEALERAKRA